jgi:hypothetical protein
MPNNFGALPATLPFQLGLVNELVYFGVTGSYFTIDNPPLAGGVIQPTFDIVSALVTFFARVPAGYQVYIPTLDFQNGYAADASVSFAPIQARILNGVLETIDQDDSVGVELVANSSLISASLTAQGIQGGSLIYDVQFSNVTYAGSIQILNNFAFQAPTTNTPIILSNPALPQLPYAGPSSPYVLP